MEYLIQCLAALPLEERLYVIEQVITAFDSADYFDLVREQLGKQKALVDKGRGNLADT